MSGTDDQSNGVEPLNPRETSVLYGHAEPGGRLPVTFPATENQGPTHYAGTETARYDEGLRFES